MVIFAESLVGLILGICFIVRRFQIAKIISKYATNYNNIQNKMLFIGIWLISIVFIFGSVLQFIKLLFK